MEKPIDDQREKTPCSLDLDGFLVAPHEWHEGIARTFARADGLELTEAHWKVLRFLRTHYGTTRTVPSMRELRQGTGYSTRDLFELFPSGGPLMQAVKIAGLPKPTGCK